MEGICVGKGIVIGTYFTFRSFECKKMGSCVFNNTAEKQGSFIGSVGCVEFECDTSCNLVCWWIWLNCDFWTQYIPSETLYFSLHSLRTNTRDDRNFWCLAMMQLQIQTNTKLQLVQIAVTTQPTLPIKVIFHAVQFHCIATTPCFASKWIKC